MASKHQKDKRYLKVLKQQIQTLREECNHLHEVVDSYFKHMENEVHEWDNKSRSPQVSFEKVSISVQQAIAYVVLSALKFTGEEDDAKTLGSMATTKGETTMKESSLCSDKAGSEEQNSNVPASVTVKISMLEEACVSLKGAIKDIQRQQADVDVKLKDISTEHDALNQKVDMVKDNNLNSKKSLQNNIKKLSDNINDMSTCLHQLEENGNARLDKLEKETKTIRGSKEVASTNITSVRSCVNDAVKSIESLLKRTQILEQKHLDILEEVNNLAASVNILSLQPTVTLTENNESKIAQSNSVILKGKSKFRPKNEPCKDDCQNKISTNDRKEEDGKDGSQDEYATVDSCKKKNESSLFYGIHETHVSEGGETDLHKHFVDCKKNPGHKEFLPVKQFNIRHMPSGYHDNNLVEFIKATSDLTVRVDVKMASTQRPEFWPNTNQAYPFYDKRGNGVMRLGTGMVWNINKWTEEDIKKYNKGICRCHTCQHSDTPSKVWGEVMMYTARQVVFDDLEARYTTCRLFYDRQDSPLVTLDGWTVDDANIAEDRCVLTCMTCDLDLLDKLYTMMWHWRFLWNKVNSKYKNSREKDKLTFIVSHPHGCPKHISVGLWINRYQVSVDKTKYTYTTCTCPGSSGAHVHSLGYDGLYYVRHVHSGVNSDGINFSSTGRDIV